MTRRYTPKELRAMTLKELDQAGSEVGLEFTKHHNRAQRSRRILAAYGEEDLARDRDEDMLEEAPTTTAGVDQGEPRPAFEALIDGPASPSVSDSTASPQRGGVRPGAGRPTYEQHVANVYDDLPDVPHPAIKLFWKKVFEKWSRRVGSARVQLSEDQAVAIALAWTHVYYISPLKGRIPPWLTVLVTTIWTTYAVFDTQAAVAREEAAKRKTAMNAQMVTVN